MSLPGAVESLRCRNPDCTLVEGGVCARSAEHARPLATCPDLIRVASSSEGRAPDQESDELDSVGELSREAIETTATAHDPAYAAPWSGRHMSEAEVDRLMGSSLARVLGIVGPFGAGKTCLLSSLFLLLADGQCTRLPYRFAASRTLFAFQTLGHELTQWDGRSDGLMVSHTPRSVGVHGGFLHLALRPRDRRDDRLIDLLLCDIAGEFFSEFASLVDAATRARMAFLRRCDGFVLVVDGPELLGARGRRLDAELSRMLGRVIDLIGETRGKEPPAIVVAVSKSDALASSDTENPDALITTRAPRLAASLRRAREQGISCDVFSVSAIPVDGQPRGVQELFGRLLSAVDRREVWGPIREQLPEGPFPSFLAHRRWRDER
jgi:hypothetical protein